MDPDTDSDTRRDEWTVPAAVDRSGRRLTIRRGTMSLTPCAATAVTRRRSIALFLAQQVDGHLATSRVLARTVSVPPQCSSRA